VKLNPQLNRQAIRQELLTVQKLIETPHKTGEDLVKSLSSKAPHLSSAASQAFVLAKAEMHKHVSAMNPEAKKGVEKVCLCLKSKKYHQFQMRLVVAHAKLDMGDILGSIMGGGKGSPFGSMFNVAFSIIKNLFSRKILCLIMFNNSFSLPNVLLSQNKPIIIELNLLLRLLNVIFR
jgi:hypothetical protein